mmetsp:Transcript_36560/g.97432  ORF Transcript_36560/g.97432 Transcript_36560/m.97432 type:complete len:383 (-) Transcript_36560:185-1333(-)
MPLKPHAEDDSGSSLFGSDGRLSGSSAALEPQVVEIPLPQEILSSLCRRSRRRLHDMQMRSRASIRLDRLRSVMLVTGSQEAVNSVRAMLGSLGGPHKTVSPPVWAELMRTRTWSDHPQAAIWRLQKESGCRIHIERTSQEVRLFGSSESITVAGKLIDAFAEDCSSQSVLMATSALTATEVQSLACACGVTFRIEPDHILILGFRNAVASAVEEVKRYAADRETKPDNTMMPNECFAQGANSSWGGSTPELSPANNVSQSKTFGIMQHQAFSQDASLIPVCERAAPCPTCGVGRFCVHCGEPFWHASQPIANAGYMDMGYRPFLFPANQFGHVAVPVDSQSATIPAGMVVVYMLPPMTHVANGNCRAVFDAESPKQDHRPP